MHLVILRRKKIQQLFYNCSKTDSYIHCVIMFKIPSYYSSQCNESAIITGLTLSIVHLQGLVGVAVVVSELLFVFAETCHPANSYLTLTGTRPEGLECYAMY